MERIRMLNGDVNWKKTSMILATVGAALTIMVSWEKLEFLPRWAWYTEVVAVQEFSEDTRRIVMNQEWFRLSAQLKEARVEMSSSPRNRELIEKVTRLEQQLRAVEEQLELLKKR